MSWLKQHGGGGLCNTRLLALVSSQVGRSEFSWLPLLSGGWGQVSGYSPPIPNCSHPRPDSLVQNLLDLAKDHHGPLPLTSLEAVWITLAVSWLMRREGSGEGLQAQDQCPVPWPQPLWDEGLDLASLWHKLDGYAQGT